MDACTYKSITGLSNYEGFKSALRNSPNIGGRYNIEDENILFNKIENLQAAVILSNPPFIYELKENQVAVVLNVANNDVVYMFWQCFDINNSELNISGIQSYGVIIYGTITPISSDKYGLQIAIFDLF